MTDTTEREELEFSLTLSGTYWRQPPEFAISINGELIQDGKITQSSSRAGLFDESSMSELDKVNSYQEIVFKHSLEPGEHQLEVSFLRKDPVRDTVFHEGKIVNDLMLTVEGVKIDGVDLGILRFRESEYKLAQQQTHNGNITTCLTNVVTMGYPGTWCLKFQSPFYLWLLERI